MIRCIALDDEPLALAQITSYINKVPFLVLVKACSSPFEAMSVLSSNSVDLIFADINMPDLNGMDFVKSLVHKPMVVFTTAYSEYAVEGFKIDALDYLLKPFGFNDFLKAANKALRQVEQSQSLLPEKEEETNNLFIKTDYKMLRLDIDRILYIESQSEYVRIFMEDSKPIMTLLSMKSLEEKLPEDKFMRIHRSYIVHLQKIYAVAHNRVVFHKEVYIPIGNQYKDRFNSYIEKHFLGKI
ncbi:LytTR family DNA-binding domain-containing protein [Parabacteroides sp. PF5-9]|uniref:LytR/AlgR family response regulator transcription factor n=1 Tax=Parabacteroides sp. PF5-9 TaxID=1742404 RepID=UPI00247303AD|nr:LytTR family DNA-binding domain-containing protein [Parabacteroides sp. PF5-9]MDH6358342.1 DNA-binding LytR/AlgR family response regulator [Parabacteroides sp. PF5-9]